MNWPLKKRANGTSESNGSIIDMAAITKIYDTGKIKVEALRGINLEVHKGKIVSLSLHQVFDKEVKFFDPKAPTIEG